MGLRVASSFRRTLKVLAKDKKDKSDETPTLKLQASATQVTVNLRYPGQYFDVESNLNYNYLRSYRPADGRYTQPDPIGLAGGWNRLGYVGGMRCPSLILKV